MWMSALVMFLQCFLTSPKVLLSSSQSFSFISHFPICTSLDSIYSQNASPFHYMYYGFAHRFLFTSGLVLSSHEETPTAAASSSCGLPKPLSLLQDLSFQRIWRGNRCCFEIKGCWRSRDVASMPNSSQCFFMCELCAKTIPREHKLFWEKILSWLWGNLSEKFFEKFLGNWARLSQIFWRKRKPSFCWLSLTWPYKYLYILVRHDMNSIDLVLQGNLLVSLGPIPNEFIVIRPLCLGGCMTAVQNGKSCCKSYWIRRGQ